MQLLCSFYVIGGATQCAEIDAEAAIRDTLSSYCSIVLDKPVSNWKCLELGPVLNLFPYHYHIFVNHKEVSWTPFETSVSM